MSTPHPLAKAPWILPHQPWRGPERVPTPQCGRRARDHAEDRLLQQSR